MKIQVETNITITAKATIDDNGKVKLRVSGFMPYGQDRTASAFVEGGSDETIELFEEAFEALIAENQNRVVAVTHAAQSEAMTVAARMGEL